MAGTGVERTFVERRGAGNFLAGFLVLALGFAAWRGAHASPIAAGLCGLVALLVAVGWGVWRVRPPTRLEITGTSIRCHRGDRLLADWHRTPEVRLRLVRNRSGAFLSVPDAGRPAVALMGYDVKQVALACRQNGWLFE